jgi:LPPG:FO 2-phospho-L-lactate transferase
VTSGVVVLGAGVGTARLLAGMVRAMPPERITAIINTGDDVTLHGLHVSPDLDTVTYTLAGAVNPETGWGLAGETWQAMDMVRHYGGLDWFNLGDRDLGTHLFRTHRLSEGASLAEVTSEIVASWGLELNVLPVTNDPLETRVTVVDEGEIGFQEYFVRRHHDVAATAVRFAGAEESTPAPGVIEAIANASLVVVAPSNPIVSIGPLLAVPGVRDAVAARRNDTIAVSGILAGKALKGPADRLLTELGHEASVVGVARLYRDLAATLVVDDVDSDTAPLVEAEGIRCVVTDTVMTDPQAAATLCHTILSSHEGHP